MAGEILAPLESSGFIKPKDHLGHLVIFTTVHGSEMRKDDLRGGQMSEVLTVDWACFNCGGGPNAQLEQRAQLGSPYVVSKIRRDGNLTLGYFRELPPKPGFKDGAQIIEPPNPEDIPRAAQWWEGIKASVVQGPVDTAPPANAWGTPAAAAPAWGPPPPTTPPPGNGWGTATPSQPQQQSAWGAPQSTPASGTTAVAATAVAPAAEMPTTVAQLTAMPTASVQALVAQGFVPIEAARAAGHNL